MVTYQKWLVLATPEQFNLMIAINVLILVILVFEHGNQVCNAASAEGPRSISSFLRRRRTISNSNENDPPTFKTSGVTASETKGRIFFGLRQPQTIEQQQRSRTKSNDRIPTTSQLGYFSYFLSGITKAFDAIEDLEKEFDEKMEQEKLKEMEQPQLSTLTRDSLISRLLAGSIKTFDNDDEKDDSRNSDSGSSEYVPKMAASGITINDGETDGMDGESHDSVDAPVYDEIDELSDVDIVNLSELTFDGVIEQDIPVIPVLELLSSTVPEIHQPAIEFLDAPRKLSATQSIYSEANEEKEKAKSEYIILSDSDSESWEKIEMNMIENVAIIAHRPQIVALLDNLANKQKLVDFLTVVFVKLAKRIFFRSSSSPSAENIPVSGPKIINPLPSLNKHDSNDDFVEINAEGEEEVKKMGEIELLQNGHRFLDYETAQSALFYVDMGPTETEDWEVVPLCNENFAEAMEFISLFNEKDKEQIEVDLPRLPARYYNFYAERRGRELIESDAEELRENIRSLLAFILAFEEKEEIVEGVTAIVSVINQRIVYTQGFDQVVAYFAINFDLKYAGTIAYRFFQLFMAEIVNVETNKFREVVCKIDARAVKMIRGYLRDQIGATVLNFEVLLGILAHFPFSDRSATTFYFNSATNLVDLDRLIQFLVLRIPHSQAHKSISLLAAANMLYSMLALDKLFQKELGSEKWTQFKDFLNDSNTRRHKRIEILDYLVSTFMGEIFLFMSDKIIHHGQEFDEFLDVAQSLIPYLHEFD